MTFQPNPQLEERAEVIASALAMHLRQKGIDVFAIAVEASPVTMSPYMHVYVYLTSHRHDGAFIQISHAEEFSEPDGYLVSSRKDHTDESEAEHIPSLLGVKDWVVEALS